MMPDVRSVATQIAAEDYVARPAKAGVLVLELKSFPSNTRLYKAVAEAGLPIDCSAPRPAAVIGWLGAWAEQTHHVRLPRAAAGMLLLHLGLPRLRDNGRAPPA